MAFCRNCGMEIGEGTIYCPGCGANQNGMPTADYRPVNDSGSIGWAILGFFIPLVGFILWLAWMGVKPKCSKMAGLGVLVFIIFWTFVGIAGGALSSIFRGTII